MWWARGGRGDERGAHLQCPALNGARGGSLEHRESKSCLLLNGRSGAYLKANGEESKLDFLKTSDVLCPLNWGCKSSRERPHNLSLRICNEDRGPACLMNQLSCESSDSPKAALWEKPPSSQGQHATVLWPGSALSCGQGQLLSCGRGQLLSCGWGQHCPVAKSGLLPAFVWSWAQMVFRAERSNTGLDARERCLWTSTNKMLTFPKSTHSFHQICTLKSILYYYYYIWNFVKQVFVEMCFLSWWVPTDCLMWAPAHKPWNIYYLTLYTKYADPCLPWSLSKKQPVPPETREPEADSRNVS